MAQPVSVSRNQGGHNSIDNTMAIEGAFLLALYYWILWHC